MLWGGLKDGDRVLVDSAPLIYLLEDHAVFAPRFEGRVSPARGGARADRGVDHCRGRGAGRALRHGQDALAKRYEKAMEGFDIVAVSQAIAVTAARLRANAGLRLPDALQAATALEIGAVALVTHDRDFSKLNGLRVLGGE